MKHSKKDSHGFLNHQDKVNSEIFHAIEALGGRLKVTENTRGAIQNRLDDLESGAEVDQQTGKYFLPLVIDPAQLPDTITGNSGNSSRAMVLSSFVSFFVAVAALGIALMQQPVSPVVSSGTKFTELNIPWEQQGGWQTVDDISKQSEQERVIALLLQRLEKNEQNLAELQERQTYVENQYAKALLSDIGQFETADASTFSTSTNTVKELLPTPKTPSVASKEIEKIAKHVAQIAPAAGQEKPKPVKKVVETVKKEPVKKVVSDKKNQAKSTVKIVSTSANTANTAKTTQTQKNKKAPVKKITVSHLNNIKPDISIPVELKALEDRAFAGEAAAQHDIGALYASGQVMASNYKRAAYWFLKAAEGGVANAHYNLGVMYHQGMGLKRDVAKALYWYREAAALGHPEALYNLGIAYVEGIGTPVDTKRGIGYLKRAASVGVAQAAYNLGVLYEGHFSSEPDGVAKAVRWYDYAGEMGYADGTRSAERLRGGESTQMANRSIITEKTLDMPENLNDIETAAGYELFPPVAMMEEGSADDSIYDARIETNKYPVQLVSRIQRVLIDMDLLPGKPTGTLSPKTADAIKIFQKGAGMTVDGRPSQNLLDFLLSQGESR